MGGAETDIKNINTAIKNYNGEDSDSFYVIDGEDRIILKVNKDGLFTTNLNASIDLFVENDATVGHDLIINNDLTVKNNSTFEKDV